MKTVFLLVALSLAVGPDCGSAMAAQKESQWRRVALFSGDGHQNTAPFTISGSLWRIRWITKQTDPDVCHFSVTAIGADRHLLANTNKAGAETSYGKGKGRFNLEVSAVFVSWKILVEELR